MTWVRQVNGQIYNWGLRAIHQRLLGMMTTQILGSLCKVISVLPVLPIKKGACDTTQTPDLILGDPRGIRTPVTGVRGRRPKPLDDGTM